MKTIALLAIGLVLASPSLARDFTAGAITILHPASHSMVPGAKVGDGLLTITNGSEQPDRLIGASSPRARSVQLHEMKIDNGIMTMRELKGGLVIPAGGTVELEPDYHLMFMDVAKPFRQGEEIEATLTFEKAGEIKVAFTVGKIAGPLGPEDEPSTKTSMQGMDMGAMPMPMPGDPQQTIPATLKTMFETADKPLTIEPVVVQGDWAVAGWRQDGRGGRALLQKTHHGWNLVLCSGDSIKDVSALQKAGLSSQDSAALAAKLRDAEAGLGSDALASFASFEGTLMISGKTGAGHGGDHEGHAQ